jgi:hypothetical protein
VIQQSGATFPKDKRFPGWTPISFQSASFQLQLTSFYSCSGMEDSQNKAFISPFPGSFSISSFNREMEPYSYILQIYPGRKKNNQSFQAYNSQPI